VLTGAGISAESGLKTFRDSDGLWEGHSVEDVATPMAWERNPALVLEFYNQRRKQGIHALPNAAHRIIAEWEADFDVQIITQNVDNLHEKAGSTKVLHLHGELMKSRSTQDPSLVYDLEGWELNLGDTCELGSQLRPNIVWFYEDVPAIQEAAELAAKADVCIVVGTSLVVYPAAGLVDFVPAQTPIFVVDPSAPTIARKNVVYLKEKATVGMEHLKSVLAGLR